MSLSFLREIMLKTILCGCSLFFFCSVALSAELPDSSRLPRMPKGYQSYDSKGITKNNPMGMSVYDTAEREMEEDIFGSEVISLEESKKILSERKKLQEKEKLKQGE